MTPHDRVLAALAGHPAVRAARATGSRVAGDPTPLSDWDVEVETLDPEALRAALPELLAPLQPLAEGWDPNGDRPTYMLLLAGPAKVDIILANQRQPPTGPMHAVTAATLGQIDHHFWDWTLWLAAKELRGAHALVERSLRHQYEQLLAPMGVSRPPPGIVEAIDAYREAYLRVAQRLGVPPDRRLDDAVAPAVLDALARRR